MNFGVYSYAMTVIIFIGLAMMLYLAVRYYISPHNAVLCRSDWKTIGYTMLITTCLTGPSEWVAMKWRAWAYNPKRTLDAVFLGAEVESYLYISTVTLVVGMSTLLFARREDRKRSARG